MKYIYTPTPIEQAARDIADTLTQHLQQGERVLWLVSGGSSIPIATAASHLLESCNLSRLFVSLTDERYGEIGHSNENWQQLLADGFSLHGAQAYRPLIGENIETTTNRFHEWLSDQLQKADYAIGIFGLGTDGHTAGIKPQSIAVHATQFAAHFRGEDFERLTITCNAIRHIDEAFIQASGADKKIIINELLTQHYPLDEQPAQILKAISHATIYTNVEEQGAA